MTLNQGWQVFAAGWKKRFFHGKNHPGKNSFCRQKLVFVSNWQNHNQKIKSIFATTKQVRNIVLEIVILIS